MGDILRVIASVAHEAIQKGSRGGLLDGFVAALLGE